MDDLIDKIAYKIGNEIRQKVETYERDFDKGYKPVKGYEWADEYLDDAADILIPGVGGKIRRGGQKRAEAFYNKANLYPNSKEGKAYKVLRNVIGGPTTLTDRYTPVGRRYWAKKKAANKAAGKRRHQAMKKKLNNLISKNKY